MHIGAESAHAGVLVGQPLDATLDGSSACPQVNGSDHPSLKAFNALCWTSIGLLFAHAVLLSVAPSFCLLGCQPAVVAASIPISSPASPDVQRSPEPGP